MERLIERMRRGPPGAQVARLEASEVEAEAGDRFEFGAADEPPLPTEKTVLKREVERPCRSSDLVGRSGVAAFDAHPKRLPELGRGELRQSSLSAIAPNTPASAACVWVRRAGLHFAGERAQLLACGAALARASRGTCAG